MRFLTLAAAAVSLVCAGPARAQTADANIYTAEAQRQYQYIQGLVLKAADKVGEDLYAFKPTPAVRSLGGVLGHIADANMLLCGVASGKPIDFDKIMKDLSSVQVHEKKTAKAELIAALKESSAYCDSIFAQLNDTSGRETGRVVRGTEDGEADGAHHEHEPRVGTLRESRHLHATQGHRPAIQRALSVGTLVT